MQGFVQIPKYSFKGTFLHRIPLVVFFWNVAILSISFFMRCGAPAAHDVSSLRENQILVETFCKILLRLAEKRK